MFGIYSNTRLSENERRILNGCPDDYNWYCVIMRIVFHENRLFQVRDDITLPDENKDATVLIFEGGDIVYFDVVHGDIDDEDYQSIAETCSYLDNLFNQHIYAYILCDYDRKLMFGDTDIEGDFEIRFATVFSKNGEKILSKLINKLKNHEEYTVSDSVDHMILPYYGYKNKKVFTKRFNYYMDLVEAYGR